MSTKQNLVFITGNVNKLKEVREILGDDFAVVNVNVDLQEIQSTNVKEVIEEKIKEANVILRKKETMDKIKEEFKKLDITVNNFDDFTVVCEDTGFHIDSMNIGEKAEKESTKMFPGALIKFYLQALGAKGIIDKNKSSDARVSCYIGVIKNGQIVEPVEAVVEGKVAETFSEGGFGFDPCFVPKLSSDSSNDKYRGKSYAELPGEIKNQVSHRGLAFSNLKKMLMSKKGGNLKKRGGGLYNSENFKEKYLKYKSKYLELVNKMRGGYMTAIRIELKDGGNEVQASKKLEELGEAIGLKFHGNLTGTTRSYYHFETQPGPGIDARDYLLGKSNNFKDITSKESKRGGPFVLEITYSDLMNIKV
jgi:non-canonical purine NTP pyrophosphatase (RdgB/HAM1 family)